MEQTCLRIWHLVQTEFCVAKSSRWSEAESRWPAFKNVWFLDFVWSFECIVEYNWLGVWLSLARAPGLGPGGRRFESCHPDFENIMITFMREWLRGGAPPCQGGGRGFESRLALFCCLTGALWFYDTGCSGFFVFIFSIQKYNCNCSGRRMELLRII